VGVVVRYAAIVREMITGCAASPKGRRITVRVLAGSSFSDKLALRISRSNPEFREAWS